MKTLRLEDFTQQQVERFDEMHEVLSEFNASIGTDNELPVPNYKSHEMAEYSGYRQILIAWQCDNE